MLPLSAPFIIKTMETKNRFLRSATMENMADAEGYVTDDHYRLYFELAQGGAGLLITGAAAVQKAAGYGAVRSVFGMTSTFPDFPKYLL